MNPGNPASFIPPDYSVTQQSAGEHGRGGQRSLSALRGAVCVLFTVTEDLTETTAGGALSWAQLRRYSPSRKEDMAAQTVGSTMAED